MAADLVRRRVDLVAENALLRQQLIVAERKLAGRVRWTPWQRFMIVLTHEWRQLGVTQSCSSSPRLFFAGIAQDSARSGGVALGGPDDPRPRVPPLSGRWRRTTHAGRRAHPW